MLHIVDSSGNQLLSPFFNMDSSLGRFPHFWDNSMSESGKVKSAC